MPGGLRHHFFARASSPASKAPASGERPHGSCRHRGANLAFRIGNAAESSRTSLSIPLALCFAARIINVSRLSLRITELDYVRHPSSSKRTPFSSTCATEPTKPHTLTPSRPGPSKIASGHCNRFHHFIPLTTLICLLSPRSPCVIGVLKDVWE